MSIFDSINIGAVIARERKKRGMTQGDVADFVGVSKAAVSKWELGVSLPDITLLPKLSGLFSISLEELLDYEATLSQTAVQEVRDRLFKEFRTDANTAFEHLDTIVRLHYSSWSLLLTAASMLLAVSDNYAESAKDSERFIDRAVAYCERVERNCPNEALTHRAKRLHAVLLLLLLNKADGHLDDIVALLGPNAEMDISSAPLLAEAYFISGDTTTAYKLFQHMLANGVGLVLGSLPFLMQLMPSSSEAAVADCSVLASQLYAHFGYEVIDPLVMIEILFSAASTSLIQGDEHGAQRVLSLYAVITDDLNAPNHSRAASAPLGMLAKAESNESLGELADSGNTRRYIEAALRILRSHTETLSSKAWTCLVGTEGYESALAGARRAISRLDNSVSPSDTCRA